MRGDYFIKTIRAHTMSNALERLVMSGTGIFEDQILETMFHDGCLLVYEVCEHMIFLPWRMPPEVFASSMHDFASQIYLHQQLTSDYDSMIEHLVKHHGFVPETKLMKKSDPKNRLVESGLDGKILINSGRAFVLLPTIDGFVRANFLHKFLNRTGFERSWGISGLDTRETLFPGDPSRETFEQDKLLLKRHSDEWKLAYDDPKALGCVYLVSDTAQFLHNYQADKNEWFKASPMPPPIRHDLDPTAMKAARAVHMAYIRDKHIIDYQERLLAELLNKAEVIPCGTNSHCVARGQLDVLPQSDYTRTGMLPRYLYLWREKTIAAGLASKSIRRCKVRLLRLDDLFTKRVVIELKNKQLAFGSMSNFGVRVNDVKVHVHLGELDPMTFRMLMIPSHSSFEMYNRVLSWQVYAHAFKPYYDQAANNGTTVDEAITLGLSVPADYGYSGLPVRLMHAYFNKHSPLLVLAQYNMNRLNQLAETSACLTEAIFNSRIYNLYASIVVLASQSVDGLAQFEWSSQVVVREDSTDVVQISAHNWTDEYLRRCLTLVQTSKSQYRQFKREAFFDKYHKNRDNLLYYQRIHRAFELKPDLTDEPPLWYQGVDQYLERLKLLQTEVLGTRPQPPSERRAPQGPLPPKLGLFSK